MKRPLQLSLAIALALSGTDALALGLGTIHVNSKLNQPLDAEIPVLTGTQGEAEGLAVQLAAAEDFDRVGLNRSRLSVPLEFSVVKGSRGDLVIKVTSREVIREPFLDFLVEANWPKGRLLREYTVLLDPPVMAPATGSTAVAAAPKAPAQTQAQPEPPKPKATPAPTKAPPAVVAAPRPEPAPAKPAPAPAPKHAAASGEYTVEAGDTLSAIARETKPDDSTNINQMMLALLKQNPNAFYKDNINALKRGAILRIPSADQIKAVGSASEAAAAVHSQIEDWRGGAASKPTLVADTGAAPEPARPPAKATAGTSTSGSSGGSKSNEHLALVPPKAGKDTAAGADRPGSGASGSASGSSNAEIKAELARTKEALASREQEAGELKSRVKDLEETKSKTDRLISLKDSEIADLQQKLKDLQSGKAGAKTATTTPAATTPSTATPSTATPSTTPSTTPAATAGKTEAGKVSKEDIWGTASTTADGKAATPPTASTGTPPPSAPTPAPSTTPSTAAGAAATPSTTPSTSAPSSTTATTDAGATSSTPPTAASTAAPSTTTPSTPPSTSGDTATASTTPPSATPVTAPPPAKPAATTSALKPTATTKPTPIASPWYEQSWVKPAAIGAGALLLLAALLGLRKRKAEPAVERGSIAGAFGDSPIRESGGTTFAAEEQSLRASLENDPANLGLHLELLSLLYSERNAPAFEDAAAAMHPYVVDAHQPEWLEAKAMGQELAPHNPLFAEETLAAADEDLFDDEAVTARHPTPAFDHDDVFDFESGPERKHEQSAFDTPIPASTSAFDFDLGAPPPPSEPAQPAMPPPGESAFAFDSLPPLDFAAEAHREIEPLFEPEAAPLPVEEDEFAGEDGVGTKLDLAKAYLDMGDPEGARSMLEEVLAEGNDSQKGEARKLMAEIR